MPDCCISSICLKSIERNYKLQICRSNLQDLIFLSKRMLKCQIEIDCLKNKSRLFFYVLISCRRSCLVKLIHCTFRSLIYSFRKVGWQHIKIKHSKTLKVKVNEHKSINFCSHFSTLLNSWRIVWYLDWICGMSILFNSMKVCIMCLESFNEIST